MKKYIECGFFFQDKILLKECIKRGFEYCELLLDSGFDLNYIEEIAYSGGFTETKYWSEKILCENINSYEIIKYLLEHGAKPTRDVFIESLYGLDEYGGDNSKQEEIIKLVLNNYSQDTLFKDNDGNNFDFEVEHIFVYCSLEVCKLFMKVVDLKFMEYKFSGPLRYQYSIRETILDKVILNRCYDDGLVEYFYNLRMLITEIHI